MLGEGGIYSLQVVTRRVSRCQEWLESRFTCWVCQCLYAGSGKERVLYPKWVLAQVDEREGEGVHKSHYNISVWYVAISVGVVGG